MRLKQKVAVVTGGGSGIGRASAVMFAKEGANVVVADIHSEGGNETARIIQENGGQAVFVQTDVTKKNDVKNMIQKTVKTFGKVDILLNNAGIGQKASTTMELTEEEIDKILAVNLKSIFFGVQCAIPVMRERKRGVILIMASIAGVRPRSGASAYAASKGAANILAKALALELAPDNIRVNVINPVVTETPMLHSGQNAGKYDMLKSSVPLNRIAAAEDIAYAALYLASDEADMITGAAINVDGGRGI